MRPRAARRGAAVLVGVLCWTLLVGGPGGAHGESSSRPDARASASEVVTANWAPFVGTYWVACTQGNPSPWGVCDDHHSYVGAIDFPMPEGDAVYASGPGEVVYVNDTCVVGDLGCEGGGGRWVGVEHPDGRVSRYMHLDEVAVDEGDAVDRGTVLGTAGVTGNATSSHLHYDEQWPLWTRVDQGDIFACHGTTFVRYPDDLGYATWAEVPYGTAVRSDGDRCAGDLFYDVSPWSPFEVEIGWMAETGLTTGYVDGTFHPLDAVTRQAVSAWFFRLAAVPPGPSPDPGFADVPRSHTFFEEIAWMVASNRSTGYVDGTFRPLDCVTRQAMVAFLHREAGAPAGPFAPVAFSDVAPDHPFATEIAWAAATGVSSGFGDGTFRPADCVTRQAAAAFLHRVFG